MQCINVSFFRENIKILCNINLNVNFGDILLITGRNGAGKTTLLRILSGVLSPCVGHVYCSVPIAYLGHQNACRDLFTVRENIEFWGNLKNNKISSLDAINLFKLSHISDVLYKHLSSGYKKKVALAGVLMLDAKIWLLDEPFVNLDEDNIKFLIELIKKRAQHGAVIFTSHTKNYEIDNMKVMNI